MALADAKKVFGFFNTIVIAKELEGNSAVAFLQNDAKEVELVPVQFTQNIELGLPNQLSLEPAWFKPHFQTHHCAPK